MNSNREAASRLSRWFSIASLLVMGVTVALLAGIAVAAFVDPKWLATLLAEQFGGRTAPLDRTHAAMIALVLAFQGAVFLYALNALRNAFAAIAKSDRIDAAARRYMRRAGAGFAINAALMVLMHPIVSAIYSAGAPAGEHFVTMRLGTGELLSLFLSGMLFITGHLITVAAGIEEENRQIV